MKKVLLTLTVIILGAVSASAQVSAKFNLNAGYSHKFRTTATAVGTDSKIRGGLDGLYVGGECDINVVSGFIIAPGLTYYMTMDPNKKLQATEYDHTFSIPVSFKYEFILIPELVSLVPFLGPRFDVCAAAYTKSEGLKVNYVGDTLTRFNVGLNLGLSVDIMKSYRLTIGYNYGFLNRSTHPDLLKIKYSDINVGLAYIF